MAKHPRLWNVAKHGAIPALVYFSSFCLLTFPLIGNFFSVFFADQIDGMQNVWNIWWVNQVVHRPDLYPSIWYTNLLHWPAGTTLVGHTLTPFNGFLAVVLLSFFSLKTTFNVLLIFAFVTTGMTTYWLAYYLTRSFWAGLLAGFVVTFSGYHFAHAIGSHLPPMSMEWLPLFLLCWYVLLTRPGPLIGLGAALAFWLVSLCDPYYFLFCILTGGLMLGWYALQQRSLRFLTRREYLVPLALFLGAALLLVGPQMIRLLISNQRDPLIGAHDPAEWSLDLLALVIPGASWLFNGWTESYWSRLPGNPVENSGFLALPVFVFVGYLWARRKSLEPAVRQQLILWSFLAILFFLLALGPVLHVAGTAVWGGLMPYTLLARLLPFLSIAGLPARMVAIVILSTAILSAFALRELLAQRGRMRWITIGLLAVLVFQAVPAALPTSTVGVPDYVTALAQLPEDGGVLNLVKTRMGSQLYYQTVHGKPIAFGYVSRLPSSVTAQDEALTQAILRWDYPALRETYRIGYIVSNNPLPAPAQGSAAMLELLYDQKGIRIYRLGWNAQ